MIYSGLSKKEIISIFDGRVSKNTIDSICYDVLGGGFNYLRKSVRKVLYTLVILEINPKSISDVAENELIFDAYKVGNRIRELFSADTLRDLNMREADINSLDILQIATVSTMGPLLMSYYKLGYSNDEILAEFGSAYHLEDLEWLTEIIWHMETDEARLFFKSNLLD